MHELAIARSLLDTARDHAHERGARRIVSIHCRIGVIRQVHEDTLREAFEIAKDGSIAATAELRVTSVGMKLECTRCDERAELSGWAFECPRCGSTDIRLQGGDELELTSIEMEVLDDDRGA